MALYLSDPAAVVDIYESIISNEYNWLLLKYDNNNHSDELSLYAYGSRGLEELKNKIDDLEQVFIAFYRNDMDAGLILINYIPTSVSGVRRARALVHSRRVGAAVFKKHQTTLTVSELANLTPAVVHRVLDEPDLLNHLQADDRNTFPPADLTNSKSPPSTAISEPVWRSYSEMSSPVMPSVPSIAKSSSMFSNFMRRKKRTDDSANEVDESAPPPTPPKDKGKFSIQQSPYQHMSSQAVSNYTSRAPMPQAVPRRQSATSLSEFAVISNSGGADEDIVIPDHSSRILGVVRDPFVQSLLLPDKWAHENILISDPAERMRLRMEAQRRKEIDEEDALREEAERQADLKRRKEDALQQEVEDEARRRALLEDELRRVTIERKRMERLEKEEDERKRTQFETRKRLERERRLEEHRKLEEWRKEHARLAEETAQRVEDVRRQDESERRQKIKLVDAKVKRNNSGSGNSLLTGWVTLQTNNSLFWKRRFFKFIGSVIYLYRSPEDIHHVLDKMELRGMVRELKEWNEGYEDLEAIAHSFAVEFKDDRGSWSMFADSEEEKYKLLGLLHHAAGL